MKKLLYLLTALVLFSACQEKYKEDYPVLKMDNTKFTYTASSTKALLYIYYNGEWTAEVTKGADWATLDKTSGSGVYGNHLRFSENPGISRLSEVTVRGGEDVWVMTVIQSGRIAVPKIIFEKGQKEVPSDKTQAVLAVDSNIPFDLFKNIVPTAVYPEATEAWITEMTILDREEPAEIPDMPDGSRRFLQVNFAENTTGLTRGATIELSVTDATGSVYSGSMALAQSTEPAKLILPEEDRVSKLGGVRNVNITTNLGEEIAQAQVSVEYTAGSDFISDVHVTENAQLIYTVSENTGEDARKANITVSYDGLSSTIGITQKAGISDYSNYTIESIYDFLDWASDYSVWKATDKITLATDLDLTGQLYVPRDFPGTFDGGNHTIKGLDIETSTSAGFFTTLSGALKNVTFGTADNHGRICTTSTTAETSVGLVASLTGSAVIDNVTSYMDIEAKGSGCVYVGGIAALCGNTGSISNCANYGKVSLTPSTVSAAYIGGIAGYMTQPCAISHCDNYGEVYCSATTATKGAVVNMAGLLGKNIAGGSLEYCNNSGVIKYENTGTTANAKTYMSGMLGMTATAPLAKFDNCKNLEGADIINIGPTNFVSAGGFIGEYQITTPVSNCSNEADLFFQGTSPYHYVGGGIGNIPLNVTAGVMSHNTVKSNITLSGSTSSGLRAAVFAGAIGSKSTIEDCHAEGSVKNISTDSKGTRLAAFVGSVTGGTTKFTDCSANCSVINECGAHSDAAVYIAGFIAYNSGTSLVFTNCNVTGTIKSSVAVTGEYVGGFYAYGTKACTISNCSSACDITIAASGFEKSGEFFGYSSVNTTVSGCYVCPSTFAGVQLTASNYGTYLQGSTSKATSVNTTNVTFKEK